LTEKQQASTYGLGHEEENSEEEETGDDDLEPADMSKKRKQAAEGSPSMGADDSPVKPPP
jgi:hypothetical protein